ncbi:hypothetical protein ColTof3_13902 [Colletotrichum tofieldiae]|nr:hypothetical protein ColTof3_13902 [Colletotrichum tofieldiae]
MLLERKRVEIHPRYLTWKSDHGPRREGEWRRGWWATALYVRSNGGMRSTAHGTWYKRRGKEEIPAEGARTTRTKIKNKNKNKNMDWT